MRMWLIVIVIELCCAGIAQAQTANCTVVGHLLSPNGSPAAQTQLNVISVVNSGSSLVLTPIVLSTDADGLTSFTAPRLSIVWIVATALGLTGQGDVAVLIPDADSAQLEVLALAAKPPLLLNVSSGSSPTLALSLQDFGINIPVPPAVQTFNNRSGAISLTSSDISTALNFTPLAPGTVVGALNASTAQIDDARLSSDVVRRNIANLFSAHQTFSNGLQTTSLKSSALNGSGAVPFVNGSNGALTQDATNLTYAGTVLYAPYLQAATAFRIGGNDVLKSPSSATNIFVGNAAGNFTVTGSNNTAVGQTALSGITSGMFNVAVGVDAARRIAGGSQNVAIGVQALYNSAGWSSVAIGHLALRTSTQSTSNVAIGQSALYSLDTTSGSHNVAVGVQAGYDVTTGAGNIFFGVDSGRGYNPTGANRFIAGSYTWPIRDVYFGSGEGTGDGSAPVAYTLHGSGANGIDTAGADLTIASGRGTGKGASGAIVFQYAPAGTTGNAQNTAVEVMRIASNGNVGIGVNTASPAADAVLDVRGGDTKGFRISPRDVPGPPTTGVWTVGTIVVDSTAVVYICVGSGAPGTWQRIGAQ